MEHIGFNKPYLTGKELEYIEDAVKSRKLSGNGKYTYQCHQFFEQHYRFRKCLLTSSCTDALEMAAILCDIQPGDEVIAPSYTFVSTANAFVLRGAKMVFVDSRADHPGMDEKLLDSLITPKTKVIVPVHYAGVSCDMDIIMSLAKKHNLFVVEDAAQAIDSYYKEQPLGSIGHLAAFSFHETKNIISGEGGMLVINDERFLKRAEIIWEKGTNRSAFWRGEVDKYGWVDIGSSFLPSEIMAAFLYAQLENLESIQKTRKKIWNRYLKELSILQTQGKLQLPTLPTFSDNNAHMFYLVCNTPEDRADLILFLRKNKIDSVFHYISLHKSPYFASQHDDRELINADLFSARLLRLPFFFELTEEDQSRVIKTILAYFNLPV